MSKTTAEKIDGLYAKFVDAAEGASPAEAAVAAVSAFSAAVFMPTPEKIAAFAARFGLTAADLTGDNAEQQAVTAKDPSLDLTWPRIAPLPTPLTLDAVEEYAGMGYRPDGTHAVSSKAMFGKFRHVVELLAAPECNTADAANKILTEAGDAEPKAVCISLLTGLITFPQFGSPSYRLAPGEQGSIATPDDVIAKLTEIPAPAQPYDPTKPGPGGRL